MLAGVGCWLKAGLASQPRLRWEPGYALVGWRGCGGGSGTAPRRPVRPHRPAAACLYCPNAPTAFCAFVLQPCLPTPAFPTHPPTNAGLPHVRPSNWLEVDWGSVQWLQFLNVMFWWVGGGGGGGGRGGRWLGLGLVPTVASGVRGGAAAGRRTSVWWCGGGAGRVCGCAGLAAAAGRRARGNSRSYC